jgi:hypothetical protein
VAGYTNYGRKARKNRGGLGNEKLRQHRLAERYGRADLARWGKAQILALVYKNEADRAVDVMFGLLCRATRGYHSIVVAARQA